MLSLNGHLTLATSFDSATKVRNERLTISVP